MEQSIIFELSLPVTKERPQSNGFRMQFKILKTVTFQTQFKLHALKFIYKSMEVMFILTI